MLSIASQLAEEEKKTASEQKQLITVPTTSATTRLTLLSPLSYLTSHTKTFTVVLFFTRNTLMVTVAFLIFAFT